jgi:hypothetical protein
MEVWGHNVFVFIDKDDCIDCPSVTNGIDDILDMVSVPEASIIVTCGSDGMWTRYNKSKGFSFLGWSRDETQKALKKAIR